MLKQLTFWITVFFISGVAQAQQLKTLVLDNRDLQDEYMLRAGYMEILEDKGRNLNIGDILRPEYQQKFELYTKEKPVASNAPASSAFWIKFKVRNQSDFDKRYIFESYSPHTEDLRLYLPDPEGNYVERMSGQQLHFYDREYINKNLVLDFAVPNGETIICYAKVYSKEYYSSFDFRFKTFNYFSFYSTNEYLLLGFYYGILIIMAIYNLLLFFSLKEKVYLYFVLYIICGILNTVSDDGLGYQYLWSNGTWLQPVIGNHFAPFLLVLAFFWYTRTFLQLKENFPEKDLLIKRVFYFYMGCYILFQLLQLAISGDLPKWILYTQRTINVLPYLAIFIVSVYVFLKEYRPARFFILGSVLILLSIVIIQLSANGTITGNILTVYSLNYALIFDVLVFSLALSERIKFIKRREEEAQEQIIEQLRENEKLSDKVNRELEQKVLERTVELNEANEELLSANEKLKEMTDKANEMSAKLDIDNWQLQKSNKEAIKARIKDEEVSFEEFGRIFPDEMACYKYLNELKWTENFKCKKCNHTKYMEGAKPYSRKCTRCAYPESVTAYTLFHGLRFSIVKAFYLTYLTHRQDNKKTLRELSEMLELRRNTCWNFKKKVQEVIDKHEKDGKKKAESWEDIIFLG